MKNRYKINTECCLIPAMSQNHSRVSGHIPVFTQSSVLVCYSHKLIGLKQHNSSTSYHSGSQKSSEPYSCSEGCIPSDGWGIICVLASPPPRGHLHSSAHGLFFLIFFSNPDAFASHSNPGDYSRST